MNDATPAVSDGTEATVRDAAEKLDSKLTNQVSFVDNNGNQVLDMQGRPMQRPEGMPPAFFVAKARELVAHAREMPENAISLLTADLTNFRQGGAWDAQRMNGEPHGEYLDYSTVAIGIYAQSAGIEFNQIMTLQDTYAWIFSKFGPKTVFDETYRHLPLTNVWNTRLGYRLAQDGLVGS